jgi:hypothetical protein
MDGAESQALTVPEPATAPAVMVDFSEAGVDVDGEEYGKIIERTDGSNKSRLGDINTEERPRSSSLTSLASSLSPTISPDSATGTPEFPFSIEQPPPTDVLEEQLLTVPYTLSPKGANDNRLRGNSISSISTGGSASSQLSWSSTTAMNSVGNDSTTTPTTFHLTLPSPTIMSPRLISYDILDLPSKDEEKSAETLPDSQQPTLATRRSRVPTDIDICSISSHAQAEALVQLAQKSILDMEDVPGGDLFNGSRSPLSAKLAAYGESLALERWFKQVAEGKTGDS